MVSDSIACMLITAGASRASMIKLRIAFGQIRCLRPAPSCCSLPFAATSSIQHRDSDSLVRVDDFVSSGPVWRVESQCVSTLRATTAVLIVNPSDRSQ